MGLEVMVWDQPSRIGQQPNISLEFKHHTCRIERAYEKLGEASKGGCQTVRR